MNYYDEEMVDLVNHTRAFVGIDFTGDVSGMVESMSNHAGSDLFEEYQASNKMLLLQAVINKNTGESPWNNQHGGAHYKSLTIQPLQYTLGAMGYEAFKGACHNHIARYTTRKKDNEVEQLKKARHILDLWIYEAEQHANGEEK